MSTTENSAAALAPRNALVGVDIGGTKIDVAVVVDGTRHTRRLATDAMRGAAQAIDRALSTVSDLATEAGATITAIGVAVPGAVDNGVIRMADNIPDLEGLDLASMVGETFPDVELALVNDLNAAATAQLAAGLVPRTGVGVVIGLGTGTAAGIIVDGQLRSGARGAAGEIGYSRIVLPGGTHRDPARLEDIAGGRALDRLAADSGLRSAQELLDRAETDAATAAEVIPRLDAVGRAIAFCQHLLDPDALVVFGGVSAHPLLRSRVEAVLAGELPDPPTVRWLAPGTNASLEGTLHHAAMLAEAPVPA
ncbi:glucokinase [Stackebrandtia endophytica]|uniref:Glucokinase n=1 Tax=Stackebrandtia endophytica TaxID=1496996 RepID=A0A543ASQ8_9ACTN|nr:ROK family protein [Stackebrandtia endophytica]TQL75623.1 glucokinase [Stackebrandtia endophytica]